MPASHPRYITASICMERKDCRSHRSPSSIDHHLLPSLSHLRTSSEAWRQSTSSQGTPQLRQVVSGTPPRPYMETSSRSSAWQVDRPAPKRQQPPAHLLINGSWLLSAVTVEERRYGLEVPAHKALHSCVRLSQGRLPDPTWKRRPSRPHGRWIDQLQRDNNRPPAWYSRPCDYLT